MLDKYAPLFASMPPTASARMWLAAVDKYPGRMPPPNGRGTGGAALYDAAASAQLYGSELVMAVVDSPDQDARAALDHLMGKPIAKPAPERPLAGAQAHCNYPNCSCPTTIITASVACHLGLPLTVPAPAPPADPPPRPAASTAPARRDPRVVLEVVSNPRKPGSAAHAGYACWVVGDTVDQCIARGLPRRYVRKDVLKGRVKLGPVPK